MLIIYGISIERVCYISAMPIDGRARVLGMEFWGGGFVVKV
jgi:hypothetical protein